ncbi:MAG: penicillin acylase family protein, partial [Myxococcota bacterium]
PDTGESIFFDVLATDPRERSEEIMLDALTRGLDWLESDPTGAGEDGFGTADMDQWLWGLRHQVRFESLLADFLPPDSDFSFLTDLFSITTDTLPLEGEPTSRDLKWFPRPGDNFSVDASNPGFSGTRFTHGSGPVMRMVIALKEGEEVSGVNIVPGGRSGLTDSPFFADQAALWLGNDTVPIRYSPAQVAEGATGREVFKPAP